MITRYVVIETPFSGENDYREFYDTEIVGVYNHKDEAIDCLKSIEHERWVKGRDPEIVYENYDNDDYEIGFAICDTDYGSYNYSCSFVLGELKY